MKSSLIVATILGSLCCGMSAGCGGTSKQSDSTMPTAKPMAPPGRPGGNAPGGAAAGGAAKGQAQ